MSSNISFNLFVFFTTMPMPICPFFRNYLTCSAICSSNKFPIDRCTKILPRHIGLKNIKLQSSNILERHYDIEYLIPSENTYDDIQSIDSV